ncbi:type VI secretion system tube protein Hcp [Agromyces sp. SYSU K20354]|uniref:Hcp family type VI secretion system effector n=1 Tax=Agromyces cavernae TaxID=2898659 RepID=UPI001E45E4A3|nr:type VI secretion system tube protein Hcp [Agromyces cavernae]MCD2441445.1 type VI secretion system tube protein Hcp [Agromyces cavernae]
MIDMFIKIGAIKGESKDARHRDEIDVLSWAWGESQSAASGGGGGGGAGKVTMQDFSFTHLLDAATPHLMKASASGTHIPEAVFSARKAGSDQQDFLVIKLQDVMVTAVSTGGSEDGSGFGETVALSFTKIRIEYRRQNADGSAMAASVFEWDVRANKNI